jgi:DNA-binding MarR family transcriptional regulator
MLRLLQYRSLFGRIKDKTGSLSATEAYAVDVIFLLGEPTIKQFSEFIGISQPNASYKVNSLMSKGYITKEVSEDDRREYHLRVTDKFLSYYESLGEYVTPVVDRLDGKYTPEQIELFDEMLGDVMSTPEISKILDESEYALKS